MADHMIVMHRGKVIESGESERVFTAPSASYTKKLLDAVL